MYCTEKISKPATKKMMDYANVIAETLNILPPDYDNFLATHKFISENNDEFKQIQAESIALFNIENVVQRYEKLNLKLSPSFINDAQTNVDGYGVYMLWENENLLYVGKSMDLKNRIISSINERWTKEHIPSHFSWFNTPTIADMHILEPLLIAFHKPHLNTEFSSQDYPTIISEPPIDINRLHKYKITIC